jgi:hypothetical protein
MDLLSYKTDIILKKGKDLPNEKVLVNDLKSILINPRLIREDDSFIIKFSKVDSFLVYRFINEGEFKIEKSGRLRLVLYFQYQFILFCFITAFAVINGIQGSMEMYETTFIIVPIWTLFFLIKYFVGIISKQIIKNELE